MSVHGDRTDMSRTRADEVSAARRHAGSLRKTRKLGEYTIARDAHGGAGAIQLVRNQTDLVRRKDAHGDDALRLEAESNGLEPQEALNEKSGAGQQNQRERHRRRGRGLEHRMTL